MYMGGKKEKLLKRKGKKKKNKRKKKKKLEEHYGQVKILSKIHNSFFVRLKMNSDDPKNDSFFPNQRMRIMPSILKVEYMLNMGSSRGYQALRETSINR